MGRLEVLLEPRELRRAARGAARIDAIVHIEVQGNQVDQPEVDGEPGVVEVEGVEEVVEVVEMEEVVEVEGMEDVHDMATRSRRARRTNGSCRSAPPASSARPSVAWR